MFSGDKNLNLGGLFAGSGPPGGSVAGAALCLSLLTPASWSQVYRSDFASLCSWRMRRVWVLSSPAHGSRVPQPKPAPDCICQRLYPHTSSPSQALGVRAWACWGCGHCCHRQSVDRVWWPKVLPSCLPTKCSEKPSDLPLPHLLQDGFRQWGHNGSLKPMT